MSSRARKRLIIGFFTILIVGGVASGSIFYIWANLTNWNSSNNNPPNNNNNGGTVEFKDLEIVFTDFFEIRKTKTFDAVALVKNPNLDYGASAVSYEFAFENAGGEIMGVISDKAHILPGQDRYIINPALRFSDTPASVAFKIKEIEWEAISEFSLSGLTFKDTQFISDSNTNFMKFSGIVENRSPYNLQNLEVHVVLYDTQSNLAIAAGRTDMQTLIRDQDRFFQVAWPYTLGFEPRVDFRIETNLFENSNFIRDQQGRKKFQEFFDAEAKSN